MGGEEEDRPDPKRAVTRSAKLSISFFAVFRSSWCERTRKWCRGTQLRQEPRSPRPWHGEHEQGGPVEDVRGPALRLPSPRLSFSCS